MDSPPSAFGRFYLVGAGQTPHPSARRYYSNTMQQATAYNMPIALVLVRRERRREVRVRKGGQVPEREVRRESGGATRERRGGGGSDWSKGSGRCWAKKT